MRYDYAKEILQIAEVKNKREKRKIQLQQTRFQEGLPGEESVWKHQGEEERQATKAEKASRAWGKTEISIRKLGVSWEHFMQNWAGKGTQMART